MKSLSDIAVTAAGVTLGIGVVAALWAVLGLFLGITWNVFKWVTGL